MSGYRSWNDFSRYTNQELSKIIHTSSYLNDISPFTQFIAIIMLTFSSLIVLNIFTDRKFRWSYVFAILPMGLSPYFLECLSYKFDSPYMALSILSSIFPIMFYRKKLEIYSIITVLCTIIMCTTYQAASGIFPIIVILLFYNMWINKDENCYKFAAVSFFSYLIGLLIFKFFIMRPTDSYVSNEIFAIKDLVPGVIGNYKKYFINILNDFKNIWLYLIGIIYLFFIIITIDNSKRNKYLTLLMSILILIIVNLLAFGLYPLLTKPLFACRAMYGVGVVISLVSLVTISNNKNYIPKIAIIVLSYAFIVFGCIYGNALSQQKRYTEFRVEQVISDLKNLEIINNTDLKNIKIVGDIGDAPEIENYTTKTDKTILDKLVPMTFGENWSWGSYYFFNYFKIPNIVETEKLKNINNLMLYKDNIYHSIYYDKYYILIVLK